MRIAVAADELTGVAESLPDELRRRGHEPILHGAFAPHERDDWAWASEQAARDVAEGRAEQAVVACWTGTGASIAATRSPGPGRHCAPTLRPPRGRGAGMTRTFWPSACA